MYQPFANADSTFRLLELVQHAPSVFNTQPWWFRIVADDRIEVCARVGEGSAFQHLRQHGLELREGDRRLSSADLGSRELIMSCGAALCNLRLAIRAAGHDLTIHVLPYPQDISVLAAAEIVTSRIRPPSYAQQELYDAIPRRHSDRWPFSGADARLVKGDPVPSRVLEAMELAAARYDSRLQVLSRPEVRRWMREAESADSKLRADGKYVVELSRWTHEGDSGSGLPVGALGPVWAPHGHLRKSYPPVRNFRSSIPAAEPAALVQIEGSGANPDAGRRQGRRFERLPQLMLLSTRRNQPLDWLRAGQALQHALLTATRYGVSASFLTQPFELRDHDVPPRPGASASQWTPQRDPGPRRRPAAFSDYPQLVMRVGYATHEVVITRREEPDVLDCRCDPPHWLVRGTDADPG